MKDEKKAVHFDDIEITKTRRGEKMEFVVKSSTKINESQKKFDANSFVEEPNICSISQLDQKQPYFDQITILVKTLTISRNSTAENGKNIQHVLIADATGLYTMGRLHWTP